ncbi:ATP binding protein [Rhizoctonia solani AG-1 IA]|uniref:ATP binding protein n=1 Tax=Thanatephorus cucumeris (strain AG1-IA) TaxID=983506 RepID=L8WT43_THACA|nr:ATP binding protein [Rhizoctonia solani AG-1 IA]
MSTAVAPIQRSNPSAHSQSHSHSHTAPASSASDDARTYKHELDDVPAVDVGVLKELARKGLIDALNSVSGAKTLVLDPTLAGPLGLVAEVSIMKQHGVDKMFWLEHGPLNSNNTNIVYLCRPQAKWMKIVAAAMNQWVQHYTMLTLNATDESSIYYAAQALSTMQRAYGKFPRVIGKGDGAKKLQSLMARLTAYPRVGSGAAPVPDISKQFDSLIIIDRSTDLITPFLTQLTYEGLLDEYFGIKNCKSVNNALDIHVDATNAGTPSTSGAFGGTAQTKKKKHHLSASTDALLSKLRDSNFAIVGSKLNAEARRLEAGRHKAQTVAQLKEFVGKIGGLQNEHQALRLHTGLAEAITAQTQTDIFNKSLEVQQNLLSSYDVNAQLGTIEDLIYQEAPLPVVLRLVALACITQGGLKQKVLESLKREILQVRPLMLHTKPAVPFPYPSLRKSLYLLTDSPEENPIDMSYTYSGYAPLSCRLVQAVVQKGPLLSIGTNTDTGTRQTQAHPIIGWKGFEDVIKSIPGETVDVIQSPGALAKDSTSGTTTMVFFLGGCTFTEVAALRWMSKQIKAAPIPEIFMGSHGILLITFRYKYYVLFQSQLRRTGVIQHITGSCLHLNNQITHHIFADIRPFTISVPDDDLTELYKKLELTRLPDELDLPSGQEWEWGIPLAVLKPTIDYWREKYDWRAVEKNINRTLPQFTTTVQSRNHGSQSVHFVFKKSDNPTAIPLLFVHGWPGNFLEVSKMVDELANPSDPKHPAFHVVAPSLPGFVFSERASTPGMDVIGTAFVFDGLMTKLGFKHYLAQGGDWGSRVCRALALYHKETCLGTHANLISYGAPTFWRNPIIGLKLVLGANSIPGGYSADEMEGVRRVQEFGTIGNAYMKIQGTRPQLYAWSDNYPWTPEELITWTILPVDEHLGPAGGLRYYKDNHIIQRGNRSGPHGELEFAWSSTPFAYSLFPKEIAPVPFEWAGLRQNLVYAKKHNKGGHFAAWEVPELLSEDIREFARIVQKQDERLQVNA